MNCLSVPISILSYILQNGVDVIHITNTRNQKWKDNVKGNSYLFTGMVSHALITKKQPGSPDYMPLKESLYNSYGTQYYSHIHDTLLQALSL